MKKLFKLLVCAGFVLALQGVATVSAQSQVDPVIFEINGQKIYKSEFMRDFLRSVGQDPSATPTACTYEKRQALEEYVQLFVNFRTKIADAYAMGLDTMPELVRELAGYRQELAAPYLIDSATMERILHEAYDRNHYVLHAAHILVMVPYTASPADTLKAYNQIMEYYRRVTSGEDFYTVSKEANQIRLKQEGIPPEDPRWKDNGDLGNFTVFNMIYPFENAAFSLNEGEISMPVRTNYGYHLIKLFSKTPYYGKTTFRHIWVAETSIEGGSESRIRQAYRELKEGRPFDIICRNYSDDNGTAEHGGLLNDMMVNQLPPEYVAVLSKLGNGELSEPFQSSYGWHILMMEHHDTIPSYEEMVPYYKQRMTRDLRSKEARSAFIEQSKKRYLFIDYTKSWEKVGKGAKAKKVYLASLDECRAAVSDSVFTRQWRYNDTMVTDFRPLFNIGKDYTAVDFLKYIESHMRVEAAYDLNVYVDTKYENFVNDIVYEYASSNLENEYPEFAELMQEYRNGLMIFSYNEQMIWSKAITDTVGFEAFYQMDSQTHSLDNEEDAPYFWNSRARLRVVNVADSAMIAPAKLQKLLLKSEDKGWSTGYFSDVVNDKKKGDVRVNVEELLVEKGHQTMLADDQWREGYVYVTPQGKGYRMVYVEEVMQPTLKSRNEARGYYLNNYQNYIEQQLIQQLRKKYNVIIHQDVVDEITY